VLRSAHLDSRAPKRLLQSFHNLRSIMWIMYNFLQMKLFLGTEQFRRPLRPI
jgi:hypothetical protein